MQTIKEWYTPKQLSTYMGVAMSTLARWRMVGEGPVFHKIGKLVKYDKADVDAYILNNRQ